MMMKKLLPIFAAAIFAAAMSAAPPAHAQIKMNIVGPGSQLSSIAVSGLKSLSGDDNHQVSGAFVAVLTRDLE
ncbi:MAG: hypothetical protein ACREH9_14095, partial [Pseudomonadota bacterium]